MPNWEAVSIDKWFIVEVLLMSNYIRQRVPRPILKSIIEPCTSLQMNIHNQVENKLKEFQWELHTIRGIQIANDLGESQNSYHFKDREYSESKVKLITILVAYYSIKWNRR